MEEDLLYHFPRLNTNYYNYTKIQFSSTAAIVQSTNFMTDFNKLWNNLVSEIDMQPKWAVRHVFKLSTTH